MLLASKRWAQQLEEKNVEFFVDNTAAMGSLRRGYSRSYHLNKRTKEWLRITADINIRGISYIQSDDNPSDALSRGHTTYSIPDKLAACLNQLRRTKREGLGVAWDVPVSPQQQRAKLPLCATRGLNHRIDRG